MRKQYHFRPSENGFYAWDVDRLVTLSSTLTPHSVPLSEIAEIDEAYWYAGEAALVTCRSIAEHTRLIEEADLSFPIIMSSDRRVMDGMHRVLKAVNLDQKFIDAVVFDTDPEPDYVDVVPEDLPY